MESPCEALHKAVDLVVTESVTGAKAIRHLTC